MVCCPNVEEDDVLRTQHRVSGVPSAAGRMKCCTKPRGKRSVKMLRYCSVTVTNYTVVYQTSRHCVVSYSLGGALGSTVQKKMKKKTDTEHPVCTAFLSFAILKFFLAQLLPFPFMAANASS